MDKMRMESPDLIERNIEKIGELFPNVITETKDENGNLKKAINFEVLKEILSGEITEGPENYEFTWPGKKESLLKFQQISKKTLRPIIDKSINWNSTENIYIEGENLEVLKLLQENYLEKIDLIYIDPPYNTGNDFIYKDDFNLDNAQYFDLIEMVDENGNRMIKNSDSNGKFHSDWCSMIYPRLLASRNLLRKDGLIFISIDEHESHNLRKICDEVFGESNFISNIIWEKRFTRSNNAKRFTTLTEPILCYAKDINEIKSIKEKRNKKADSIYSNPDNDPRGPWTSVSYVNPATKEQRPNLSYSIMNPITGSEVNHPTNAWKYEKSTYEKHVMEKRLYWGKNGENTYPRLKKFISEMDGGMVPVDLWNYQDSGTTDFATKELTRLLGKNIFDFPKPTTLIQRIINLIINGDTGKSRIILDFFSGSGTTAEAIIKQNYEDGGNRKFILIQQPELCDKSSNAYKAGYNTICDIGRSRIIEASKEYSTDIVDCGFRVFKLSSSNMKDIYYSPDNISQNSLFSFESNIKEDRSDLDLLFGCLLDWGLELSKSYSSEELNGCKIHTYDEDALIACFDEDIPEDVVREIAKRKPLRAVFRDSSFIDDASRVNLGEIFKLLSPDTEVKVL